MSLLLRLLLLLFSSRRRSRLHVLDTCVTPFRVWLNDLDALLHMNNGRYLTILDLARVDLMMRSGLWKHLKAQGWYPVVTLETIRFHRSLELGNRYDVETRVIGWDEKHIFVEQGFVRDDAQVALAVVRDRRVIATVGDHAASARVARVGRALERGGGRDGVCFVHCFGHGEIKGGAGDSELLSGCGAESKPYSRRRF
jgi:acyl-CoA thioesterase FadM